MKILLSSILCLLLAACGSGSTGSAPATQTQAKSLPQILIVGDYISEQYMPTLKILMHGIADVTHAEVPNGPFSGDGSSGMELENIDAWLAVKHYDIVHLDAITDIDPCHPYQNDIPTYIDNLTKIVQKIRATGAKVIFATATPSLGHCHPSDKVYSYNQAAIALMNKLGIQIDDQYEVINPYLHTYVQPYKFFLTPDGYLLLAQDTKSSFGYIPY
jgi:hypothetical protein